ncbi:MAG: hypothetical protein K6F92_01470 [Lachnospiraceae bacterium]|nr:hypothetical protein [Lachnospiraceae bacterium]
MKRHKGIILAVMLLLASLALGACNFTSVFDGGGGEYMSYYGCPNSKKVKKLNLKKNKR